MIANNLLTDEIFRVQKRDCQVVRMSLPSLLAALGRNDVISLPGIRSHQEDIFHIFVCSLAAAVLAREKVSHVAQKEEFWKAGLEQLTSGHSKTAWCLVADDQAFPAFMQPSLSSKLDLKKDVKASSPDELDVLQTAKNHDVKSSRAADADVESWAFALISMQTSSGFLGSGNYGIARMNGGFGSRPCVGLVFDLAPGGRFCRDVQKLLEIRPELVSDRWPYADDGLVLTWLAPWDGTESLNLDKLDPFFIEISRIVRLTRVENSLVVLGRSTKASRINSKAFNGVVGDAWTPIKVSDSSKAGKSLTLNETGFSPKLLRDLIFEDGYEAAKMQLPGSHERNEACIFHASVLVRGQGVTEGFHVVNLPVPAKAASRLFSKSSKKSLDELSKIAISDAATMQNKVLSPSLFCLLEGGPEKINFDKREVAAWVDSAKSRFSSAWSDEFFTWLWTVADDPEVDEAKNSWLFRLKEIAEAVLHSSEVDLPLRKGRGYRARASANAMFQGSFYKNYPTFTKKEAVGGKSN